MLPKKNYWGSIKNNLGPPEMGARGNSAPSLGGPEYIAGLLCEKNRVFLERLSNLNCYYTLIITCFEID
jgi:hypothetical protein